MGKEADRNVYEDNLEGYLICVFTWKCDLKISKKMTYLIRFIDIDKVASL